MRIIITAPKVFFVCETNAEGLLCKVALEVSDQFGYNTENSICIVLKGDTGLLLACLAVQKIGNC